jgi:hypothetical protein
LQQAGETPLPILLIADSLERPDHGSAVVFCNVHSSAGK